jgi:hypothetical protein
MTGPEGAPTRAAEPDTDPVRLVFGALAFGVTLGVGCQGLVTWSVRTVLERAPVLGAPGLGSPPTLLLLVGTFAGMVAAGLATGTLIAPIRNPWRQAMLAIIAGLGSFMVSLITLPIYSNFGRGGLLALSGVAALVCILIGRRLSAIRAPQ